VNGLTTVQKIGLNIGLKLDLPSSEIHHRDCFKTDIIFTFDNLRNITQNLNLATGLWLSRIAEQKYNSEFSAVTGL
jgi:hypothetical protein